MPNICLFVHFLYPDKPPYSAEQGLGLQKGRYSWEKTQIKKCHFYSFQDRLIIGEFVSLNQLPPLIY